jgi:hypothetical protein
MSTQSVVKDVYRSARLGAETEEDAQEVYEVEPRENQIGSDALFGLMRTVFGLGGSS